LRDGAHFFLLWFSGSQVGSGGWKGNALEALSQFLPKAAAGNAPVESLVEEKFGPQRGWSFQRFSAWKCAAAELPQHSPWTADCLGFVRLDNTVNRQVIGLLRLSLWPAGLSVGRIWQHHTSMLCNLGLPVSGAYLLTGEVPQPWAVRQCTSFTFRKEPAEYEVEFHLLKHYSGNLAVVSCWPSLGTSPEWWAVHRAALKLLLSSARPPK
jgi:hypothetical protein